MAYAFRIKDWYAFLGFTLLGMLSSHDLNAINLLLPAVLLAYAYSINDYFDKKVRKMFFLIPLLAFLALLPFYSSFRLAVATAFFVLFTIYSVKPLRLKAFAYISTLINAVGFPMLFLFGFNSIGSFNFQSILMFVLLAVFATIGQIFDEILDKKEDLKDKIVSTATSLGRRRSKIFLYALFLSMILLTGNIFLTDKKFLLSFIGTTLCSFYFLFFRLERRIDIVTRKLFKNISIALGILYIISLI